MFDDLIEKTVEFTGKQITQDRASAIIIDQNTAQFIIRLKGIGCIYKKFYKEGLNLEKIITDLKEIQDQLSKTFGKDKLERAI